LHGRYWRLQVDPREDKHSIVVGLQRSEETTVMIEYTRRQGFRGLATGKETQFSKLQSFDLKFHDFSVQQPSTIYSNWFTLHGRDWWRVRVNKGTG